VSAADLQAWRDRGRMVEVTPLGHKAFFIDEGDVAASADATVFLLHGFPESSYSYSGVFDLLKQRFDRVVSFDMIGYGFSEKPESGYGYSLFEQADTVLRLLREAGITGCHFVSHDMGDSVHTELLARLNRNRPEWFTDGPQTLTFTNGNMVLSAGKLRASQKALLSPFGRLLSSRTQSLRIFENQVRSAHGNDRLTEDSIIDMYAGATMNAPKGLPAVLIGYLRERMRFEKSRWLPALASTEVPVQICWGKDDAVAPVAVAQSLKREVKPDASLSLIDGLGHFLQIQDPGRWYEAVAPFWEESRTG
jgi:pimeloyl-ACP methyl ester carboxylesterase